MWLTCFDDMLDFQVSVSGLRGLGLGFRVAAQMSSGCVCLQFLGYADSMAFLQHCMIATRVFESVPSRQSGRE